MGEVVAARMVLDNRRRRRCAPACFQQALPYSGDDASEGMSVSKIVRAVSRRRGQTGWRPFEVIDGGFSGLAQQRVQLGKGVLDGMKKSAAVGRRVERTRSCCWDQLGTPQGV